MFKDMTFKIGDAQVRTPTVLCQKCNLTHVSYNVTVYNLSNLIFIQKYGIQSVVVVLYRCTAHVDIVKKLQVAKPLKVRLETTVRETSIQELLLGEAVGGQTSAKHLVGNLK